MLGSIRKRGKNSYQIRFNLKPDPATGKRRPYEETIRGTKRDAQELLARRLVEYGIEGCCRETKKTVKEHMEGWLGKYRADHRYSTYSVTEGLVRNHIVKALGDVCLAELSPSQVDALLVDMLKDGLSTRTVRYVHWILKTALEEAVSLDLIRRNVAARVKPPRDTAKETQPLTEAQVEALFREAQKSRLFAAFATMLYTGLRRGELLALKWSDIDFENMVLHVRRALVKAKGKVTVTDGKTENAQRSIPLSPALIEVLRRHKVQQAKERLEAGPKWKDTGFIFTSKLGTFIYPDNLTSRYLAPILERAGLKGIHPHRFRHTFATWCVMNGIDIKKVSDWLGHYDEAFTFRKYHHLMPGRDTAKDAKVLDEIVFRKVSGQFVVNSEDSGP